MNSINANEIGERLREIRKALSMSQSDFGFKLGVSNTAISKLEKNERNLTEQMAKSICREFKVDHRWLTTGKGEMFLDIPETLLDQIVVQYELDQEEKEIIKNFLQLTKEQRRTLIDLFKVKNG